MGHFYLSTKHQNETPTQRNSETKQPKTFFPLITGGPHWLEIRCSYPKWNKVPGRSVQDYG